jgi:hypothetical protein
MALVSSFPDDEAEQQFMLQELRMCLAHINGGAAKAGPLLEPKDAAALLEAARPIAANVIRLV